jgi:alkanesulfonate monooxygenase SsuD/methylene tetrahydromethanopterin reductase-like flavin-dependent oxidoreductase (luciferase family)
MSALSIGVAGALGPRAIAALAPEIEQAGFATLWVNDTPDGDAVAALAAAAGVTEGLRLATGVVPVDRRPPRELAEAVAAAGLPAERLTLGIGSGAARSGALARVEDAVATLRALTGARVMVGALGPRMRRLAAERADGVLLNWVPPEEAARQSAELHAGAPATRVALYVRTALQPAASPRLRAEAARYAGYPNYAAHFARMGVGADATVLDGRDAAAHRIPPYLAAVDELVLRAITPGDTVEEYRSFVRTVTDLRASAGF